MREVALHYLESGEYPTSGSKKKIKYVWPLPKPEVEPPSAGRRESYQKFPDLTTLIDIAIDEKRFDDVVDLYHRFSKDKHWGFETDKRVADAVADTRPDLALAIWGDIVNRLIAQVKPRAYEEASIFLRLMRKTYAGNKRLDDWQALLNRLRTEHKAKRRLMGVLDNLSDRKLVD